MIDSSGSAATAEIPQLDRQPLATMLRERIVGDDELRSQLAEARRRRLPRLATLRLPPSLCPADFTEAALAHIPERTPAPVWGFGITNPWATWIALNIRRRMADIIAGTFGRLHAGGLAATGLQAATGAHTCVPCHLWRSQAVALDMRDNALLAGATPLFVGIEVQPATSRPHGASRAAIDKFIASFDSAMHVAGRRYILAELVDAAKAALGDGVSALEVAAALGRASTTARAGSGRRPMHLVPTAAELAAASIEAVQTPA